jgi:hypothetical protein
MPVIMILYYIISAYIAGMLVWNFIKEKKSVNDMLLYLSEDLACKVGRCRKCTIPKLRA